MRFFISKPEVLHQLYNKNEKKYAKMMENLYEIDINDGNFWYFYGDENFNELADIIEKYSL